MGDVDRGGVQLDDVKLGDVNRGDVKQFKDVSREDAPGTAPGTESEIKTNLAARIAPRKTFAAMIGRPQQFASQLAPLQDMLATVSDMMQPETVAVEASAKPVSATPRFSLSLRKQ
jgi:hypothetical protein